MNLQRHVVKVLLESIRKGLELSGDKAVITETDAALVRWLVDNDCLSVKNQLEPAVHEGIARFGNKLLQVPGPIVSDQIASPQAIAFLLIWERIPYPERIRLAPGESMEDFKSCGKGLKEKITQQLAGGNAFSVTRDTESDDLVLS